MNAKIKSLLPLIREYFKDKPMLRAWLFGSYSRGEEISESDIDILVDYDTSAGKISLFKMGGMLMELSILLGNHVDLVDNRGLMQFAREMEIVGEAAYKLTHEFVETHPELPWAEIIGMRHILMHGYFKISPEDLWDTI